MNRPTPRRSRRSRHADAVVTGAGSGIGRAFALELAERDGRVVCADIRLDRAKATVEEIVAAGGQAMAIGGDVADPGDVGLLADAAQDWFGGPPSMVVNNAGVGIGGQPVGELSLADWEWALGINLWGPIHGCHEFVPRMRGHGLGGIINVASAASFGAAPSMAAYNVSKAGVVSLSETLAAELAGTPIAVTVLCPTFVKTNIVTDGRIPDGTAALATQVMRWTGRSPQAIARTTLAANDRGQLHVVPQVDARLLWAAKRAMPGTFTRGAGALNRLRPLLDR